MDISSSALYQPSSDFEILPEEWDALSTEEQIALSLHRERLRANLTQEQLCRKTGITQATISRLEHGVGNPSVRSLRRLAQGLGMRVSIRFIPDPDLLSSDPEPEPEPETNGYYPIPELQL